MSQEAKQPTRWRLILAACVGGAAALLYLLTMPQWLTLKSVAMVSRVAGWTWWLPEVGAPVTMVAALPFQVIGPESLPKVLNAFTCICGGIVVGLLVHSISLLPHDRTRYERVREPHEKGLLSLRHAWIPPLAGGLALTLNLTFWENAFAFSGEMIDLLCFSFLIHSLLIYRLDPKSWRMFLAAFVLGSAIANHWSFIAWTPFFFLSLLVIRKRALFAPRFLLPIVFLVLAGMLFYLVIPLRMVATSVGQESIWEACLVQLKYQKAFLFGIPKYLVLIIGLTSLFPAVAMTIRWPSNIGDVSMLGSMITHGLFFLVSLMFLTGSSWVMFEPFFGPREVGLGLSWLSFTYLATLVIGYYTGFFQLILSKPPSDKLFGLARKVWPRLSRIGTPLALLFTMGMGGSLATHNWSQIQSASSSSLEEFVDLIGESLPEGKSIVLGNQPELLAMTAAWMNREGRGADCIFVDERMLSNKSFHRQAHKRYGERWPDGLASEDYVEPISERLHGHLLAELASAEPVVLLTPQVGKSYLEPYGALPRRMIQVLEIYPTTSDMGVTSSEEGIGKHLEFWESIAPLVQAVKGGASPQDQWIAALLSRTANCHAVDCLRAGHEKEAMPLLDLALSLAPANVIAELNRLYRTELQEHSLDHEGSTALLGRIMNGQLTYSSLMNRFGPADHPDFLLGNAETLTTFGYIKQGAVMQARVTQLVPQSPIPRISLAETYLRGGVMDGAMKLVDATRKDFSNSLHITNKWHLIRIEALASLQLDGMDKAVGILESAIEKYPEASLFPRTLTDIYLRSNQFDSARDTIKLQLELNPDDTHALLNKAALFMTEEKLELAGETLDQLLRIDSRNQKGLMNRAILSVQQKNWNRARSDLGQLKNLNPNIAEVYYYLGIVNQAQSFPEAAVENLKEFVRRAPNTPRAEHANQILAELGQK